MKTVLFVLVLFCSLFAQAQRNDAFDEMMSKSVRLKNTGWKFLGAGTVLTSASLLIANQVRSNSANNEQLFLAEIMFVGGLSSIVASVPQFFKSAAYKKRAMQLTIQNVEAPQLTTASIYYKRIPAVQLKIPI